MLEFMGVQSSSNRSFDPRCARFVLVGPRAGGNVGAAARALDNLGFSRLVLVQPRCNPLGTDALRMAVNATELLERAEVHHDLDAALAGSGTVVGLSARLGKHRKPHYRLDQLAAPMAEWTRRGELAAVFGREDHGLTDEELDRCTHLVHLPADDGYPSFNLAQAVLLVAYELRMRGFESAAVEACDPPAPHEEREAMYAHLQEGLETIGFLTRDTIAPIMRRFRRMFGRAELTTDEVRMVRGVARQVLWVAGKADLARDPRVDDDR